MKQEERLRQLSDIAIMIREIEQWALSFDREDYRAQMILKTVKSISPMITVLTEDAAKGEESEEKSEYELTIDIDFAIQTKSGKFTLGSEVLRVALDRSLLEDLCSQMKGELQ